jgi:hypothetical protein
VQFKTIKVVLESKQCNSPNLKFNVTLYTFQQEIMEKSNQPILLTLFNNAVIYLRTRNCIYFNDNTKLLIGFYSNSCNNFNYNFGNNLFHF